MVIRAWFQFFLHERLHKNCLTYCLNDADSSRDIEGFQNEYIFFSAKHFAPNRQQIHIFTVVTMPTLCLCTVSVNSVLIPV